MTRDETQRRMTLLVRRWDASSETQGAFARRHGVSHGKLRYWARRVERQPGSATPMAFAPVQVVDSTTLDTAAIDVTLVTGDRLVVRAGVSGELVRAVLAALRAPC